MRATCVGASSMVVSEESLLPDEDRERRDAVREAIADDSISALWVVGRRRS